MPQGYRVRDDSGLPVLPVMIPGSCISQQRFLPLPFRFYLFLLYQLTDMFELNIRKEGE